LRDSAAQVAAAHAELDRDVALGALAIDEGCAGIERDVRDLAERDIAVAWSWRVEGDLDLADRIDAGTVFRVQPDGECKLPITFQYGRGVGAAERRLHHGVNIAGIEPVAGGFLAIDLDVEVGLAEEMEDAEVCDPLHLAHLR